MSECKTDGSFLPLDALVFSNMTNSNRRLLIPCLPSLCIFISSIMTIVSVDNPLIRPVLSLLFVCRLN